MNLPFKLGVIYCANLNRLKLMSDFQTLYIRIAERTMWQLRLRWRLSCEVRCCPNRHLMKYRRYMDFWGCERVFIPLVKIFFDLYEILRIFLNIDIYIYSSSLRTYVLCEKLLNFLKISEFEILIKYKSVRKT